jgi:hypothetical protein
MQVRKAALFTGFVLQVFIGDVVEPRRMLERDLLQALPGLSARGAELAPAVAAVLVAKLPEKLLVIRTLRAPTWLFRLWCWLRLRLSQALELPSQPFHILPIAGQLLNCASKPVAIPFLANPFQPEFDLPGARIRGTKGARNVFVGVVDRQRTEDAALARRWPWGGFFHGARRVFVGSARKAAGRRQRTRRRRWRTRLASRPRNS